MGRFEFTEQWVVPPYYPPSVRPIQELKPLMISSMTLMDSQRGGRTLVRVVTPSLRFRRMLTAMVEDEEGTAVPLELRKHPKEDEVEMVDIMRPGDVFLIKEPFLRPIGIKVYGLIVDHVSDFIRLQQTDGLMPLKWRDTESYSAKSRDLRIDGNGAVKDQNWGRAESLYTRAILAAKTTEEEQLARLNCALVNLHLDRPEKALNEARKVMGDGNMLREKSLFRVAKALYALGKYSLCLEKLGVLLQFFPKNSVAGIEIERVKQRLREEESGSYQFANMHEQAKATPPFIDCATYVGSVAVRDSPGRGKGLFTTKPVKAGELLLCEKAFAYRYAEKDNPIGKRNMNMLTDLNDGFVCEGGQPNLITQVVQKIYHNPSQSEIFTSLHHGDYEPVAVSEVDGHPVVDSFLVMKIVLLNCFGAPRSSRESMETTIKNDGDKASDSSPRYRTCGIWTLASRINHSCITNCRRSFIGDMLIIRATKDIKADTELFFAYNQPSRNETYKDTQKKFSKWGFTCDCALCLDKKSTSQTTLQTRKALCRDIEQASKPDVSIADMKKTMKTSLEKLSKTYPAGRDAALLPRVEMWHSCFELGKALVKKGKQAKGLEMFVKCLRALGYVIAEKAPTDSGRGGNKNKAMLEIKQWGEVNVYTVEVFVQMMHVYENLAPQLCEVVKEYATVAYRIYCGEDVTISELYPELKQE
ncbi:SET domain-containing protein [Hypoxylon sp. EC38]|nr:SET domain-containing protein [Hypoxylon sp. EC38]